MYTIHDSTISFALCQCFVKTVFRDMEVEELMQVIQPLPKLLTVCLMTLDDNAKNGSSFVQR